MSNDTVQLEDAMEAIIDYRGKTPPKSEAGKWLVTAKVVKDGFIRESPKEFIAEDDYDAWMRRGMPRLGDVLVTTEAPLGQVAAIRSTAEIALAQRLILLRSNPEILDQDYLLYAMQAHAVQDQLRARSTGTTVLGIKQSELRQIHLPRPALAEQVAIAKALRPFDDLISNNLRRIEALEHMARLLYQAWFVHFRLPGQTAIEMVDSELGPIPTGWKVMRVDEVAEVVRGKSYRRAELVESGGLPFLNLKCIARGGGFRKSGLKRFDGKFKPMQQTYPGDIVVAVTDMTQQRMIVGQAGRVPHLGQEFGIISLDLARVVPGPSIDREFLYGMFRYSSFSQQVKEFANGTNVLHLSPDEIKRFKFAVPPTRIQASAGARLVALYDLVDNLIRQNDLLRESRDVLLPRLVSGELDVSTLEVDELLS